MSSTKLFWSALLSSSLAFICVCVCIHHTFLPLHEIRHDLKLSKISIADGYLERFMNGLRYATISWNPDEQNFTALSGLTNFIRESEFSTEIFYYSHAQKLLKDWILDTFLVIKKSLPTLVPFKILLTCE